jgi:hypothetical protein
MVRVRGFDRLRAVAVAAALVAASLVVVVAQAAPAGAQIPAHNGLIAFQGTATSNRFPQIFTITPGGGHQTQLTTDPAGNSTPSWSPDGSLIVFVSNRSSVSDIFVMNADGTNQTRLTTDGFNSYPSFSPDGTKILFSHGLNGTSTQISVMNTDSSGRVALTNNPYYEDMPTWSPDGTKIAYASYRSGFRDLYVMNSSDGSNQTDISNTPSTNEYYPDWSPDGSKIIVETEAGLVQIAPDGSGAASVPGSVAGDKTPGFSPDGTRIVFTRNFANNPELATMALDGTGVTRLTNDAPIGALILPDESSARWQPLQTATPAGEFTPLPPTRILDTRTSLGNHLGPLSAGTPIDVPIEGNGGVPASGVEAVVMNVTVTEPTNVSHMTVWPQGLTEPNISNLNFSPGQTIPNLVTVAINNGGVSIVNLAGTTHLIIDVVGYYADATGDLGSRFHSLAPSRLFDTRFNIGGVGSSPLPTDHVLGFKVTGKGGVPASGVTAVVMNVTVTEQTSAGHLTVYPSDVATPTASNLNFVPGLNTPNLVVVKVPANGVVDFFDHLYPGNTVHVLADVVGYFDNDKSTEEGRLVTGQPGRVIDTRLSSPAPAPGCIPGGSVLSLNLAGAPNNVDIGALVLNVTVTGPNGPGFITVYPGDVSLPNASNVNFVGGQTVPNAVIVKKGANNLVDFADTGGCAHLVIDLFGYFTSASALVPTAAAAGAAGTSVTESPPALEFAPAEVLELHETAGTR